MLSAGACTVPVELRGLSLPVQAASDGVTVYVQLPAGTEASVQVSAVSVPVQPAPIVCAVPLES
jgi:hypothetical protein